MRTSIEMGLQAAPAALQIWGVRGLPMIVPGDDIGGLIGDAISRAGLVPRDGDVLVVAQKIVSKAERRQVRLEDVAPDPAAERLATTSGKPPALCQLILSEAAEVMRATPNAVIVRHRLGHVAANAGIDSSNVADPDGPETALLWPTEPDASAARLREVFRDRFAVQIAVVVSDSLGRAWRMGTTGSAIGVAGMAPVRDRRGEHDLFGRELRATVTGVADEIASAASLVMGEGAEGVPAALVRGAVYTATGPEQGIGELLRPIEQDMFR